MPGGGVCGVDRASIVSDTGFRRRGRMSAWERSVPWSLGPLTCSRPSASMAVQDLRSAESRHPRDAKAFGITRGHHFQRDKAWSGQLFPAKGQAEDRGAEGERDEATEGGVGSDPLAAAARVV